MNPQYLSQNPNPLRDAMNSDKFKHQVNFFDASIDSMRSRAKSRIANSPAGLAQETIQGIPQAAMNMAGNVKKNIASKMGKFNPFNTSRASASQEFPFYADPSSDYPNFGGANFTTPEGIQYGAQGDIDYGAGMGNLSGNDLRKAIYDEGKVQLYVDRHPAEKFNSHDSAGNLLEQRIVDDFTNNQMPKYSNVKGMLNTRKYYLDNSKNTYSSYIKDWAPGRPQ